MTEVKKEQQDRVIFARTLDQKAQKEVGIKSKDRRQHMYLLGKTRVGKSTTLANMIYSDICEGRGIALIDPYGRLAKKVLGFIPSYRINDVIYFNTTDKAYPFGFNVLEGVDAAHRHFLVTSELISIFKKIWTDIWNPRLEYVLRNTVLALLEYPGSTLLGIPHMLSDEDFQERVISRITDKNVKAFWTEEYPRYSKTLLSEVVVPIQNRIGRLFLSPLVKNIVGQVKSKVTVRDVVDKGKILIMNLNKARIGEDAATLLGAMMIARIQMAAMSRIKVSQEQKLDFYLYIDEFQNFATETFANTIAEAGKHHLNLIIAHQYIGQLKDKYSSLQKALFNNIGTVVVYRVSAQDAQILSKTFLHRSVKKTDLINLDKYHVYIRPVVDGAVSKPFSAVTLPPTGKPTMNKKKIIALSREQYTEPREIVEEKIARWSGLIKQNESLSKGVKHGMYESQCDKCGTEIQISFIPDGIRPVFCKKCLEEWKKNKVEKIEKKQSPPGEISLEEAMEREPTSFKSG